MAKSQFPESVILRLPEGTLSKVREVAEREGSSPLDVMRRAVIRVVREAFDAAAA